jgi:hypothetical protein
MEIIGIIKEVLPSRSGSTGNGDFYYQPVVVESAETYLRMDGSQGVKNHSFMVDITGRLAKEFSLQVGTKVRMNLFFRCTQWQGKWFQRITSSVVYVV